MASEAETVAARIRNKADRARSKEAKNAYKYAEAAAVPTEAESQWIELRRTEFRRLMRAVTQIAGEPLFNVRNITTEHAAQLTFALLHPPFERAPFFISYIRLMGARQQIHAYNDVRSELARLKGRSPELFEVLPPPSPSPPSPSPWQRLTDALCSVRTMLGGRG